MMSCWPTSLLHILTFVVVTFVSQGSVVLINPPLFAKAVDDATTGVFNDDRVDLEEPSAAAKPLSSRSQKLKCQIASWNRLSQLWAPVAKKMVLAGL